MSLYIIIREATPVDTPNSNRQNTEITLGMNPTECTAIVPYLPEANAAFMYESESGNHTCTSAPEGGNAAEISVESIGFSSDDRIDLDGTEDEEVPVGAGFEYDDEVINELMNDRFGAKRAEVKAKKLDLIGTSTSVAGQVWVIRGDIQDDTTQFEEFIELGLRSNDIDAECLPKRFRSRPEITLGTRSSPRVAAARASKRERDEAKVINKMFLTLFPVNWKQSLRRLNKAIEEEKTNTRKKSSNIVSEHEYWVFIGLLILCGVQKTGGVDGLYSAKQTEGIVKKVNGAEHMSYTRFKFIKRVWVRQFELDITEGEKNTNPWWRVGYLVHSFNQNRQNTVASSRVKTLDESMSAYRPQTRKTGNLPNISFILRKPEPLGTELKTVASKGSNGPIIYAEIQEGKEGMKSKHFFNTHGATSSCVLRLTEGTLNCGQKADPNLKNLFYGDSWFASLKTAVAVTEQVEAEFLGPIKTAHRHFPKAYLESSMKEWPPGSHLVMETRVRDHKYYAMGYKYNMKKVLCFIATEGAGHTGDGDPYEAKWLDSNGRMASRKISRPHMLSEYFKYSNQIDKHNHARQSQLAIEKNVITQCGYFRLWCTYLGITVTDTWKLYRHHLGEQMANKDISILAFANILCKTHLLNDYSNSQNESNPHPTLNCLPETLPRQELAIPNQITTVSHRTNISSLGSGSSGALVQIGNGKYIPSTFEPPHKQAHCIPTSQYIKVDRGSYSKKRRRRNRCRWCQANTTCQCSYCAQWFCNPVSGSARQCFIQHKQAQIDDERNQYWLSIQRN